jgi:membrane-bound serine protease (ClpP class)
MVLLLAILLVVFLPITMPWAAIVIIAGCLLEIGEVIVARRWSKHLDRRLKVSTGAESMIGRTATVVSECRPVGQVKLRGELWEARCADGAAAGDVVRVEAVDELMLVVGPVA